MTTRNIVAQISPVVLLAICIICATSPIAAVGASQETISHEVVVGDSWLALAMRYGVTVEALQSANPHPNPLRNPVIGDTVQIPAPSAEAHGRIARTFTGGLLALAAKSNQSPWSIAAANDIAHPFRPTHGKALFVQGGDQLPKDLPMGFASLELSAVRLQPGWPLAYRAFTDTALSLVTARLGSARFDSFTLPDRVVGVSGTGAFFTPGAPELSIVTDSGLLWTQPWRIVPGIWDFDQVTLTEEAAAIDQAAIAAERERMFQIWSQVTPAPQWGTSFRLPIDDYLGISSTYGARRSYNGGPYSSYHEGVDFSAYRGTPVYASGDGIVAVAEDLYVRGGAVVLDHGLGIFSGYYHMSAVHVQPGQVVRAGDLVGEVGTEGLSSGNHLHWDFLVAGTWVNAQAWRDLNLDCWILEGWGTPCLAADS